MTKFSQRLNSAFNKKSLQDTLGEEGLIQKKQEKINQFRNKIESNTNRYIFYCPDLPFPNNMVKIIYQHANAIAKLGHKTVILHDVAGFKPSYLGYIEVNKEIKIVGLSESKGKGKVTSPSYTFEPFDTIIIPDSYYTQMTNLQVLNVPVNKVVLCLGYGGLATIAPGSSWAALGFNQVWTISEEIASAYEELYFENLYVKTGYHLDIEKLTAKDSFKEKRMTVALNCRFKDQAQRIINIFYRRNPNLSFVEFGILKNNNYGDYLSILRSSMLHVMVDPYQAVPSAIMESLLLDTPTLVFGGMNQNMFTDNIDGVNIYSDVLYETEMADIIRDHILESLRTPFESLKQKEIVKQISNLFTEEEFDKNIELAVDKNQKVLISLFNQVVQQ